MSKIKVSADTVLSILQGIMNTEEMNYKITDKSAPADWQNKTVQEALNIDYYTYKHRPMDTEVIIRDLMAKGMQTDSLYSLTRSFCLLSLGPVERVFSKENDIVSVSANLEYWLQDSKVKLLEDLIEDMTVETMGIRIPVQIGKEMRKAIIVFGNLDVSDYQETTEFGGMAVCDLNVDIIFYPDVVSKSDYKVEFLVVEPGTNKASWVNVPLTSISIPVNMTQKAVPKANRTSDVGNINLSRVKSFVLTFDGYNNTFVNVLTDMTLSSDYSYDGEELKNSNNNAQFIMRLTRGTKEYFYDTVIKAHTIGVQDDTGNETHSLTLTTRGL